MKATQANLDPSTPSSRALLEATSTVRNLARGMGTSVEPTLAKRPTDLVSPSAAEVAPLERAITSLMRSVELLVSALKSLVLRISEKSGTTPAPARASGSRGIVSQPTPTNTLGITADNPTIGGGFLWKPSSDKDGKLAILLPQAMTGQVSSVEIVSPDGEKVIATGSYAGNGNGSREHFRFNEPGGRYPDGSIVRMHLKGGGHSDVLIRDTAQRLER